MGARSGNLERRANSFRRLLHEMAELRDDQLLHRQPHRLLGTRQRDDNPPGNGARAGAAHDRRRADLLVAEHAEQLAEAVEPLLQQRGDRLVAAVARRDPGAAGGDDHLHVRSREVPFDCRPHLVGIVFHDRAARHLVAGGGQHVGDRLAARVGVGRARVADRHHHAAHRRGRLRLVLSLGHPGHCSAAHATIRAMCGSKLWRIAVAAAVAVVAGAGATPRDPFTLDRAAERWVGETMKKLTSDEKIGQLIVASFESNFLSTDSETFESLARLVREYHVGGFHVFGASIPAPPVLLNPGYGTVILGQPFSAAFLINRLQAMSAVPLLNTADFETGVGFRIFGATQFPRQMAMGAIAPDGGHDVRLVKEEARITAVESRALGVQVNFAPVADVNNNPRNPVINIRAYGEDPARVASLVAAYVAGARDGGMIATIKHFPGHGDTDVDSHLGLPVISFDRARLQGLELVPFRRAIEQGAEAVMAAHIELPLLDPSPSTPATFSRPVLHDLLRREMGFAGLVYTDSMSMDAVAKLVTPGEAAVRAVAAGADQVLHSPDPVAAFEALKSARA